MTNAKAGSTREERDLHKINPIKRVIGSYISIITLSVNGLNALNKRQIGWADENMACMHFDLSHHST